MIESETTDALAPVETPAATTEQVAPPTDVTAAPEGESAQAEAKTFTQEQLNEIIQREKAKAEAKAERRAAKAYRETLERFAPQPTAQQSSDTKPTREAFNGDDVGYIEALTDWKINQRDLATRQQQEEATKRSTATRTEKLYAEASKLPTFDREAFDELPLTGVMAATVVDSDVAPQLMVWMTANPAEVERIAQLSPTRQAAAIGALEAKLSATKATKEPPAPIKTVGGGGSVANGDLSKMSDEAYYAARKKMNPIWHR